MIIIWHLRPFWDYLRSFWDYLRLLGPFNVFEVNAIYRKIIDFWHSVRNVPEQVKFARIFFLLMHEKTKSTHQRFLKSLSHQTESLISLGTSWAFSTFSLLCWFKPFKGLLIFHRTPLCYVMTVQSISDIDLEIVFLFWATTLL